jgi:hypothetical protein
MAESGSVTLVRYDLAAYGRVSAVTSATVFTIAALAGHGNAAFAGPVPYFAFVLRQNAGLGAAPQGEQQAITGYVSATGQFTITAGYTVPIAAGDEILVLHPSIAGMLSAAFSGALSQIQKLAGVAGLSGTLNANWQAAEQNVVVIGVAAQRLKIHAITIDISALAGNITLRMYTLVNGILRRVFPVPAATTFSVAGDAPAITIINGTWGVRNPVVVTAQSDNAADNGLAIAWDYLIEEM